MDERIDGHLRACAGFTSAVTAAEGRWDEPTPCSDWDVRALVEHVIGFHEVLVLGPLDVQAHRPRRGEQARWEKTHQAIRTALDGAGATDRPIAVPGGEETALGDLLPALTTDVLVHTWDLAVAVGADSRLDAGLCSSAYESARAHSARFRASSAFGAEVEVSRQADAQSKLLALLGRDPGWTRR